MFRLLVIAAVTGVLKSSSSTASIAMAMKAMDFEVYGRVQGVFFRKYTKEHADKLGLRGWCRNTASGTVLGHMQGPSSQIEAMMLWLKTTGSPSSKIEKAEFRNQQDISAFTFDDFDIIRDKN